MKQSQTPEMDNLVDQILRGERVILFPPGIWFFVGSGLTTTLGITFLVAVLIPAVLSDHSVPTLAVSQIAGVFLGATSASACAVSLINGFGIAHKVWSRIVAIAFALSVGAVVLMWLKSDPFDRIASTIAVVMLGIAAALIRAPAFSLFVLFRQRLKARRQVIVAEMKR